MAQAVFCALLKRKVDRKAGAAGLAFYRYKPVVLANNCLRNRKPQTGAICATAYHGVKQSIANVLGNAGSVVFDVYPYHQSVIYIANGETPQRLGAQPNLLVGLGAQCLKGIALNI